MGKNGDSSVCEKIYKSVTISHAFQAIRHRSGSRPASPAPNSSLPTPSWKTIDDIESSPGPAKPPKSGEAADVIPISFDYSIQAPSNENQKPKVASKAKPEEDRRTHQIPGRVYQTNPKAEAHQINKDEGKILDMHIENKFTDYINRVGYMIRSMSHVGDKKKVSGKDKFTDFINRTGGKIRTTSGIGGGRSNTFK